MHGRTVTTRRTTGTLKMRVTTRPLRYPHAPTMTTAMRESAEFARRWFTSDAEDTATPAPDPDYGI